jgi:SAM-dependent methyltransferase
VENRFEERYKTGDTPWNHDAPDVNLVDMVAQWPIPTCNALDIGCGTGDNAIWLAQQQFVVTGCDFSQTAVETAIQKASRAGVDCTFLAADFLENGISDSPFGFVFDRGCFHSVDADTERMQFVENVSTHLEAGGLWLTLVGNADEPEREVGPPQLTAKELVAAVEPYFEIVSLVASHFGSDQPDPPKAWVGLLRKREQ